MISRWGPSSIIVISFLAFACLSCSGPAIQPEPPVSRVEAVTDTLHSVEITDPYRWLEDQESPETRAWIEAQNVYTRSVLDSVPGRSAVEERLAELLKVDDNGMPRARGGRYFFSKRLAGRDLHVLYMRRGVDGADEVLVDPHPMSDDGMVSVSYAGISANGEVAAYAEREGGEDEVAIRFFDVEKRERLDDFLPKARYRGVEFLPDLSGVYYVRYTGEGPRVLFHTMGTGSELGEEIFGFGLGPEKLIRIQLSEDGRYLVIVVSYGSSGSRTDVYMQDLAEGGPIVPVVVDLDARFSPAVEGGTLFLRTNWKAPNGRILAVDAANPARSAWREIVAESDGVIRGVSLVGGRLFVRYLESVVSRVGVFETDGTHVRDIAFPSLGSVGAVSGRWSSDEAYFTFQSFHIPRTIYRYDAADGTMSVWARSDTPVKSDAIEARQVWFASKDGTRVPMFVVHPKGIDLDGSHPTLLGGYGGFTVSLTPRFSSFAVAWVESGGVYAVANLRGGGELGEEWHRGGMLANKQNTFDDFIAASEWLIESGYTSRSRLAVMGGSNGGLLVGAVLTQRPDLYRAVICTYPLLDMVRYHMFLVARFWVPEYGSSDDPEQFEFIRAYSPYHNVKEGIDYPAVLFVTGDSDTRVAPLHARKMAALLQARTGSGPESPILLLYDTKAGHSGGMPVGKQIEMMADELIFLKRVFPE